MKLNFYTIYFFIPFFLIAQLSYCQALETSRKTSYHTYIFKITNKEAEKIYKSNFWEFDSTYFHSLVDSFPTNTQLNSHLPQGHYLKAYTYGNKLEVEIATIQNFNAFILNNDKDLCIQVVDLEGNTITDAKVKVGVKKVRFNTKTGLYIDKKSNKDGHLEITYNGLTTFQSMGKSYKNSAFKRGYQRVLYETPIKYIWRPVRFVGLLPIDGVKSIVRGYAQGTIHSSKYFFRKWYRKVACIFDDYYCDYYNNNHNKVSGYLVFNKPKYLPKDTVKFKAYVASLKGKKQNKKVKVILSGWNRNRKVISELTPYRNGGYQYQFFLHDSLDLKLDKRYVISLELNNGEELISEAFKYEDYELTKNTLSVRTKSKNHFKNDSLKLYVKGTDENELNILDGRLEVLVEPLQSEEYFREYVFLPDTLLFFKKELLPKGETEILIPDTIFPKANFTYNVSITLFNADNEAISKSQEVLYHYQRKEFTISHKRDSLLFEYKENGIRKEIKAEIIATDKFGNEKLITTAQTPIQLKINPYYSKYIIEADSIYKSHQIASESANISCSSSRDKDSVFIKIDNPYRIPFYYDIFLGNKRVIKGTSNNLFFNDKNASKLDYTVSLRYVWGGEVKEEDYTIPIKENTLNISIKQAKTVYPGQKTDIELTIKDFHDNPVKNVDLTAFALTKKFKYRIPDIPQIEKARKRKKRVINRFWLNENTTHDRELPLNYNKWNKLAGLDSIEYYNFIYPDSSIYWYHINSKDSITQFAPFVFSDGDFKNIHVIEVDDSPVFFSWTNHNKPYSFRINSGYHRITLRTTNKEISIDSLYFPQYKKTIFSIDERFSRKNTQIQFKKAELTDSEKEFYYRYVFPVRNNFGERFAFLENKGNIHFLSSTRNRSQIITGPISGEVSFQLQDSYQTDFIHEPFFEYEFDENILKMRNIKSRIAFPEKFPNKGVSVNIKDQVLTKDSIQTLWNKYLEAKRYTTPRYNNPTSTSKGSGLMQIEIKKNINHKLLNTVILNNNEHDFIRVYPGSTRSYHNLDKGNYKLILFFKDGNYFIADSLDVQVNGVNFYRINTPETLKKDSFSVYVDGLIRQTILNSNYDFYDRKEEIENIYNSYRREYSFMGGDIIEGYVLSKEDNMPLPGVSVVVKGTTWGAITDLDGYYSINVPFDKSTLVFSYIGFTSQEIDLNTDKLDIMLEPDTELLQEVVVTGYSANVSKSNLASVVTTTLQGKTAGIMINGKPGSTPSILLRGNSSINLDKNPLIIIDGAIYNGTADEIDANLIKNIQVLKDEEAIAIYGVRASNGVIIINTKTGKFQSDKLEKRLELEQEGLSLANSIRDNFLDYAFWEPSLTTNNKGKAKFSVTYPNDVTNWEAYYIAMNPKLQSGVAKVNVQSYKPLISQLAVPRFLIENDSSYAIGKISNYTSDSIHLKKQFEINDTLQFSKDVIVKNSLVDSLGFKASDDTVQLKYYIEKKDGYIDGELRKISIYPKGLLETKGQFFVLDSDTTIKIQLDSSIQNATIYAKANELEVLSEEIERVINYKYLCNEQLASKLKMLLVKQKITKALNTEANLEKKINKIISKLVKNQNNNGLWGWWNKSEEINWISLHVIEALLKAKEHGFKVSINYERLKNRIIWALDSDLEFNISRSINYIKILHSLDSIFYRKRNFEVLSKLNTINALSFKQKLELALLSKKLNYPTSTEFLSSFADTTLFGSIYFSDRKKSRYIYNNDVENTRLAYLLLKSDSSTSTSTLRKIRNYFFEKRGEGYWRNTFESAQIVETILPDLEVGNKQKILDATLQIEGDLQQKVTEFPFELTINSNQRISITKEGAAPVYLTAYQQTWNDNPVEKKNDFEITTYFEDNSSNYLEAGKTVKLVAEVVIKKDAEYLMINIPIPGGCSYVSKERNYFNEVHREYFKNETSIFSRKLNKGTYRFEVKLNPRFSGNYTLNPAKVELMYFPTFYANNKIKKVNIR